MSSSASSPAPTDGVEALAIDFVKFARTLLGAKPRLDYLKMAWKGWSRKKLDEGVKRRLLIGVAARVKEKLNIEGL